jgi:hypothetical protein
MPDKIKWVAGRASYILSTLLRKLPQQAASKLASEVRGGFSINAPQRLIASPAN